MNLIRKKIIIFLLSSVIIYEAMAMEAVVTEALPSGDQKKLANMKLLALAKRKHISQNELSILLQQGAEINYWDRKLGRTPLHIAAMHGCTETCKILIENGANLQNLDYKNNTPLCLAAEAGHLETFKLLLETGGGPRNALYVAAARGHAAICVMLVLRDPVIINFGNKNDLTALHFAAMNGHAETCLVLLENNAEVDVVDERGESPLYKAAASGHSGICRILTQKKAYVNGTFLKRYSPLHAAAAHGHSEACLCLLENGADLFVADHFGDTALHLAARNGHFLTCETLISSAFALPVAKRGIIQIVSQTERPQTFFGFALQSVKKAFSELYNFLDPTNSAFSRVITTRMVLRRNGLPKEIHYIVLLSTQELADDVFSTIHPRLLRGHKNNNLSTEMRAVPTQLRKLVIERIYAHTVEQLAIIFTHLYPELSAKNKSFAGLNPKILEQFFGTAIMKNIQKRLLE